MDQNIKNFILNYFKNQKINQIQTTANTFFKKYLDIQKYLKQYLIQHPEWETIKKIIYGIMFNIVLPKCKNCGKTLNYSSRKGKYCSNKCCNSDIQFLLQKQQICLKKYGVKSITQAQFFKEKSKNTISKNIENNPNYWENIKEKRYKTIITNYGTFENFQKIKENNLKETNIIKYGCQHTFQRTDVIDKINNTKIFKYGSHKQYLIQTNEKFLKFSIEQGWKTILSWHQYIIPLFTKREYIGGKHLYKWKCVKCGEQFQSNIYSTNHIKQHINMPRCFKCYPRIKGISNKEKQLLTFCQIYFPNANHSRKILYPQEVDILIEQLKICIQFNGNWHHSLEAGIKKGYHLEKTLNANKKGYRLIHIWQDQWDNNKENIKNMLSKIFNCKENFKFIENQFILNRDIYNNLQFQGYQLIEEIQPEIIKRKNYSVQNCGYLKYKRKNIL